MYVYSSCFRTGFSDYVSDGNATPDGTNSAYTDYQDIASKMVDTLN